MAEDDGELPDTGTNRVDAGVTVGKVAAGVIPAFVLDPLIAAVAGRTNWKTASTSS